MGEKPVLTAEFETEAAETCERLRNWKRMLWELFLRNPPNKAEFFKSFYSQKLRWEKKSILVKSNPTLFPYFKKQTVCLGVKPKSF